MGEMGRGQHRGGSVGKWVRWGGGFALKCVGCPIDVPSKTSLFWTFHNSGGYLFLLKMTKMLTGSFRTIDTKIPAQPSNSHFDDCTFKIY